MEYPARSLVILAGPSGSGKSTLAARHWAGRDGYTIISTDEYRARVPGSSGRYDLSVQRQAYALARATAVRALARGDRVIWDATNLQPHYRRRLSELARSVGAQTHLLVVSASPEACSARVRARDGEGGPVTPERIYAQHTALQRMAGDVLGEGHASIRRLLTDQTQTPPAE